MLTLPLFDYNFLSSCLCVKNIHIDNFKYIQQFTNNLTIPMKYPKYIFILLSALSSLFIVSSCDEITTNYSPFAGDSLNILWTDEYCNILGGDTTDWCQNYYFGPACPNPVRYNDTLKIGYAVAVLDTVSIYLLQKTGDTLFIIKNEPKLIGTYFDFLPARILGPGLCRVYFKSRNMNSFYPCSVNYGDILVY